mgnify:CR=1 FL=1
MTPAIWFGLGVVAGVVIVGVGYAIWKWVDDLPSSFTP